MKVEARNYGKIVILNISGPIKRDDLVALMTEIPVVCKDALDVIIGMGQVEYEPAIGRALVELCRKGKASRSRLILVSDSLEGADGKDLVSVLDVINTTESARVIQIFARDLELKKLRQKRDATNVQLEQILSLPANYTEKEFETSKTRLLQHHQHEKYLFSVLGGSVAALKQQTSLAVDIDGKPLTVSTDTETRLAELKKRAIAFLGM